MRILYLNCIETNSGWGAENFLHKSFSQLGQAPYSVDYRKYRYQLLERTLKAPESDVLFVQKGDVVPLSLIGSVQRPRIFWACDVLGTRPGQAIEDQDPVYDRTQYTLIKSRLFNHLFVRTHNCIETVVSRGWANRANCTILSSGFDPEFHRPNPNVQKEIDVLFIGGMTQRRRLIIDLVSKHVEVRTAAVYGSDMVKLFNRAKIVLNIHSGPLLDTETRIYETLGCGAFLLTERLSSENPFTAQDLVQFDSVDDLVGKIRYYLAHDQEREAIAAHGLRTALNGHTYTHRAQEIIDVMSRYVSSHEGAARLMVKKGVGLYKYGLSEFKTRNTKRIRHKGSLLKTRGAHVARKVLRRFAS